MWKDGVLMQEYKIRERIMYHNGDRYDFSIYRERVEWRPVPGAAPEQRDKLEQVWRDKCYASLNAQPNVEPAPVCDPGVSAAMDLILADLRWMRQFPEQCRDRISRICKVVKAGKPVTEETLRDHE